MQSRRIKFPQAVESDPETWVASPAVARWTRSHTASRNSPVHLKDSPVPRDTTAIVNQCQPQLLASQPMDVSSQRITQSLESQSLSHSSSSLATSTASSGGERPKQVHEQSQTPARLVRKRARFSDLQQYQITSNLSTKTRLLQQRPTDSRKLIKRRCISDETTLRPHARFSSPDRFLSPRPQAASHTVSFRLSKTPTLLSERERYFREKDHSRNPFRSISDSRSRNSVRRRPPIRTSNSSPPYHIPSFVQDYETTPSARIVSPPTPGLRQISVGGVWSVGGRRMTQGGQIYAIFDGHRGLLAGGTTAPMHAAHFLDQQTPEDQLRGHESRLALALDIDQAGRILPLSPPRSPTCPGKSSDCSLIVWHNSTWSRTDSGDVLPKAARHREVSGKAIPTLPFRVLDAPNMKDDYYCSILAYSQTCRTLAVALTNRVYLWTEADGVHYPPIPPTRPANFVTSLSFSSHEGAKAILAISRHSGRVSLWSLLESDVRFETPHQHPASCVSFKPIITYRQSSTSFQMQVPCEDLLVADDAGYLFYYSVEWPVLGSALSGSMNLLAKISAHGQNICGLAWCPDGEHFATGGNDNSALFFETARVLGDLEEREVHRGRSRQRQAAGPSRNISRQSHLRSLEAAMTGALSPQERPPSSAQGDQIEVHPSIERDPFTIIETLSHRPIGMIPAWPQAGGAHSHRPAPGTGLPLTPATSPGSGNPLPALLEPELPVRVNTHTHSFYHSAAVKALAFAPWEPTLLATGGGSNDRQIHFHHTISGATLAVINVFAQVTSLVWSKTRREIVATFGYAQPEHEVRIAVFAWPSCECVTAIPWEKKSNGEFPRALWAIPYPGGPNDAIGRRRRNDNEGDADATQEWTTSPPRRGGAAEDTDEVLNVGPAGVDAARRSFSHLPSNRRSQRNRAEGEVWASRTKDEGSLIIACCDETVKFFEVWAGRSKGNRKGRGIGSVSGVLGGSRILEGELGIDLGGSGVGGIAEVIR